MIFDIITIFPKIFDSYLKESFIKKAREKGLIKINIHNLRNWAKDRRKTIAEASPHLSPRSASPRLVVDDRPFGGGLGMVLKIEPIYKAVKEIKQKEKNKNRKVKVILFTPRGKKFNQQTAYKLSKLDRIIMICGRYEGVDERVAKHIADMELSIGDYDLMGGEIPAMAVTETIARLIPGVLGKPELLEERITKEKGFIEYPQYTRPESFSPRAGKKWQAPKVLLSGHHKKIGEWRKKYGKVIEK
ncbi:MAG: tRNA (guanine(37)-N(1))-methyltransferase [bacterium]|nr:tRNA (guanine(37)-N(1))-methyltransferase [bacterium]